jgi:hypothetical protein
MARRVWMALPLLLMFVYPAGMPAQSQGAQPSPGPQQPPAVRRPATPPKPQPPMTLRQVVESLLSLKNSGRVETLISRRGVQFQGTPAVLDILKEFGAGPRLLSMIPMPPAPPVAPSPKVAGPLNVVCEPKDCSVVIGEAFKGTTTENKATVSGLQPGEHVVQVFADGYDDLTQKILLEEGKPAEAKFSFKRPESIRKQSASASMLKAITGLGGTDGMAELGDIEGDGVVAWTDNAGAVQEWPMTFKKRVGKDLATTFKTKEGQCTASIFGQTTDQQCRGGLRGSGENIAAQATSLFLSYQLQDVMQALLNRPLVASETSDDRLESSGVRDAYQLTLGPDGLPLDLTYRTETDMPIQVQYSNYLKLPKGMYPGRTAIGRANSAPVFVFTIKNVRTNLARNQK